MPASTVKRRGSTMILVVSILVLLVIIASAFVSRTQAGRMTASAQQQTAAQSDRVGPIADAVTKEISQSLFAQPVNINDAALALVGPAGTIPAASSSMPRLAPNNSQTRFSIDPLDQLNNSTLAPMPAGDGIIDGYNFAPFEVRPWTNWPDIYNFSPAGDIRLDEGNPVGNPGFGDTRWLRSTEPVRVVYSGQPAFSHWSHLSWIPTANNGWRLVTDISNIESYTLTDVPPGLLPAQFFPNVPLRYALDIPYEQWLPSVPPDPNLWIPTMIGVIPPAPVGPFPDASIPQGDAALTFQQLAFGGAPVPAPGPAPTGGWFSSAHPSMMSEMDSALPNFLRLKWFGPKYDEFVLDSPRNIITRTLCDTDGDGFTDSFWFLAPSSLDRSIRHVVGVSVVDNSALLNVNIASRFDLATTGGKTPSDLALVGRLNEPAAVAIASGREVGYLSSQLNTAAANAYSGVTVQFDPTKFGSPTTVNGMIAPNENDPTFLAELGVVKERAGTGTAPVPAIASAAFPNFLKSDLERTNYFKAMSQGGEVEGYFDTTGAAVIRINGMAQEVLEPFTMADEFELRAYTGHNNPYLRSRLERALETEVTSAGAVSTASQFLRSAMTREETSEYFDQLDARQLLFDNRRKLTTASGARNELMPPWLWTLPPIPVAPVGGGTWPPNSQRSWKPLYEVGYGALDVTAPRSVPPQGAPDLGLQFPAQPGAAIGDANCDGFVDQRDVEIAREQFLRWNRKVDINRELFVDNASAVQLNDAQHDFARDIMKVLQRSLLDVDTRTSVFGSDPEDLDKARRAAASWTANLIAARDGPRLGSSTINIPTDPPLHPDHGIILDETPPLSFIGQEKHPFIVQAFFAVVYPKTGVVPADVPGAGNSYVCYDQTNNDPARIVLAVQIANPYNEPISLWPFQLRAFGQPFQFLQPPTGTDGKWGYGVDPILGPATEEGPRTAVIFAIPKELGGDAKFRARMMNALDLTHPWLRASGVPSGAIAPKTLQTEVGLLPASEVFPGSGGNGYDLFEDNATLYADSMLFNASKPTGAEVAAEAGSDRWDLHPKFYYDKVDSSNPLDSEIAIVRLVGNPLNLAASATIVVDRLENEYAFASSAGATSEANRPWREALKRLLTPPSSSGSGAGGGMSGGGGGVGGGASGNSPDMVPPKYVAPDPGSATQQFEHIDIGDNEFLMTWARISRPWVMDVDGNMAITSDERSPRYVFAMNSAPVLSKTSTGIPTFIGLTQGNESDFAGAVFTKDDLKTKPDTLLMRTVRGPFAGNVRGKPTNFTLRTVLNGADRIYPSFNDPVTGTAWPGTPGLATAPTVIFGDTGATIPKPALDFYRHPLRMSQRDGPFEQIAEVLDVPVWGPVMQQDASGGGWSSLATYGEMMVGARDFTSGKRVVNQSQVDFPTFAPVRADATPVVGDERETMRFLFDRARPAVLSVVGFVPPLPAGSSILDGFTLDGAGLPLIDTNRDASYTAAERLSAEQRRLRLAAGFNGGSTQGLINVNTAPLEVLRALPQMQQLSYNNEAPGVDADLPWAPTGQNGDKQYFVRVPESIINYRERFPAENGFMDGPKYVDRGFVQTAPDPELYPFHPGMRSERGIVSVGELALVDREYRPSAASAEQEALEPDPERDPYPSELGELLGGGVTNWTRNKSWGIHFAGRDPYRWVEYPLQPAGGGLPPAGAGLPASDKGKGWRASMAVGDQSFSSQLSTDRLAHTLVQTDFLLTPVIEPTLATTTINAGDQTERNSLLKGIANLVTTRSDVFTVYLKVRSVSQDPATGIWDATNPATLVEESRYLLVVDRSKVERPGDQPKILMFEKIVE